MIPFNKPYATPSTIGNIIDSYNNLHWSGNGPFTKKCEAWLEDSIGAKRVLLVTSCTHALEMIAMLIDIKPGDEVIVPSFTFVSTVNAFLINGAKPIFADICLKTLNITPETVAPLLTSKTKAIVLVHYAGVACDMYGFNDLIKNRNIILVEDNAHGLFGKYKNKNLGSIAPLAALSFHETKNMSCGEGGALIINDERYIERAEIIREKGTNRAKFFKGEIDKYTWVDVGSSYILSDVLAAILWSQLQESKKIQTRRQVIWKRYLIELSSWADNNSVKLPPYNTNDTKHPYHMFYLRLNNENSRDFFIQEMKKKGISSVFHYLPLHLSPMGEKCGGYLGQCQNTELVSKQIARLPLFVDLDDENVDEIITAINNVKL